MRISERDYDEFVEDRFPNMVLVRAWSDCNIWSAGIEEPLLVLVDGPTKSVAVFEYDTPAEREKDIRLVCSLRDGGGGDGGGVPAAILPRPPSRSGSMAEPLPIEPSDDETC